MPQARLQERGKSALLRVPPHFAKYAKRWIRRTLRRFDIEVSRYRDSTEAQRIRFMGAKGVSLVLDVGANSGQYATRLRRSGYRGRLISFEPTQAAFEELRKRCVRDPLWESRQIALGEREGEVEVNVSGNSVSSSLLPMLPRHAKAAPGSEYVGREVARMTTLDSLSDELIRSDDRVAVKLDVQGYEAAVIMGADRTLARTQLVEAELSLVPLYDGQSTICEIVELLQANGFDLVLLERNFRETETGYILQVDGIFVRADV